MERSRELSVILLGQSASGKSSLLNRYIYDEFEPTHAPGAVQTPPLSVDFAACEAACSAAVAADLAKLHSKHRAQPNEKCSLHLWDVCMRFKPHRGSIVSYVRDSDAAIVTYSIADRDSFRAAGRWIDLARSELGSRAVLVLVGTKLDFEQAGGRQVTREAGLELARFSNSLFLETSAAHGRNVKLLFQTIVDELMSKLAERRPRLMERIVAQERESALHRGRFVPPPVAVPLSDKNTENSREEREQQPLRYVRSSADHDSSEASAPQASESTNEAHTARALDANDNNDAAAVATAAADKSNASEGEETLTEQGPESISRMDETSE